MKQRIYPKPGFLVEWNAKSVMYLWTGLLGKVQLAQTTLFPEPNLSNIYRILFIFSFIKFTSEIVSLPFSSSPYISIKNRRSAQIFRTLPLTPPYSNLMDALDSVVDPLREFSKDSIRLVKRCHKPDRKGNNLFPPLPSSLYRNLGLFVIDIFLICNFY